MGVDVWMSRFAHGSPRDVEAVLTESLIELQETLWAESVAHPDFRFEGAYSALFYLSRRSTHLCKPSGTVSVGDFLALGR
jgi:hypothetical protein